MINLGFAVSLAATRATKMEKYLGIIYIIAIIQVTHKSVNSTHRGNFTIVKKVGSERSSRESCLHRIRTSFSPVLVKLWQDSLICRIVGTNEDWGLREKAGRQESATPQKMDSCLSGCVKAPKIQSRKTSHWHGKYPPFPRRACPWLEQGRESSANTARNAHIRAMVPAGGGASLCLSAAPSLRPEGARSARFIRWIPAFAGMARGGMGMAE